MSRLFISLIVFFSLLSTAPNTFAANDALAPLVGTWEYRQRNSSSASGCDHEGERLELTEHGASIQGLYLGLEREGEHGLFCTLVKIKDFEVCEGARITFCSS